MIEKNYLAKIFLIIIFAALHYSYAHALTDVFAVRNQDIKSESVNLFDARLVAEEQGTKDSFEILLKRLLPKEDYHKINNLKDESYRTILDVVILDERMTAFDYSAKANFIFNKQKVKKVLNERGIFFNDKRMASSLVIPVLCEDNNCTIWDEDDWIDVWDNMPKYLGMLQLKYTMGDLDDETSINPALSIKAKHEYFAKILKKYNASNVILVICNVNGDNFTIDIKCIDEAKIDSYTFKLNANGNRKQFYQTLADECLWKIDSYYKNYLRF